MRPWSPSVGCVGVEALRRLALEEEAHLGGERRPVGLEGEEVVRALGADRLGDLALATDGVDGDQRPREFRPLEQERDGGDLVALRGHRSWPSTRRWRFARAETRCSGWPARARARREVLPSMATMSGSASRKLSTHDANAPAKSTAGRAFITSLSVSCEGMPRRKGSIRRRNASLRFAQRSISTKPSAPARATEHDRQHLRQRINHLPRLARVFQRGEVVKKGRAGHGAPRVAEAPIDSHETPSGNPPSVTSSGCPGGERRSG